MNKLKGKVAIVRGASKGIGAGIAKAFAAERASVIVNYASSKAGADAVVSAITAAGGKAAAVGGDVSKAPDAQTIIDAAIKNYGLRPEVIEDEPLSSAHDSFLSFSLTPNFAGPLQRNVDYQLEVSDVVDRDGYGSTIS